MVAAAPPPAAVAGVASEFALDEGAALAVKPVSVPARTGLTDAALPVGDDVAAEVTARFPARVGKTAVAPLKAVVAALASGVVAAGALAVVAAVVDVVVVAGIAVVAPCVVLALM